ncbi:MAG: hypothetical protein NC184_00605 [Roseburia sp.]|nr:hypothetical protein [Roseburia sp.]
MAQKSSELKKRCQLAKQRLKMGYWESVKLEREQNDRDTAADGRLSANAYIHARLRREAELATGESAVADEKMYKKVCAILDSDEVAMNPIGQLIDVEVYSALDAAGKQRYVLELSNKFRELKERYYRERTGA